MPYNKKFAAKRIQRKFRAYRRRRPRTALTKLKRDVAYIKRSAPPAEIKMCDTGISMKPTVTVPTLKALSTPDSQGTAIDSRVGANVRFNHISAKLRVKHSNWGDIRASATVYGYVIWLKNADYSDDFEANFAKEILNKDQNGQFSPMCYFNKQRYGSWIATNKFKVTLRDLIPLSQGSMGLQSATGNSGNTSLQPAATLTNLGKTPQEQFQYVTLNKRINVTGEWQNKYTSQADETKMTRMKPYLFCYTDCVGQDQPSGGGLPTGVLNDSVAVQGTIRLSYQDA